MFHEEAMNGRFQEYLGKYVEIIDTSMREALIKLKRTIDGSYARMSNSKYV